ncbi:hypothetical protein [Lachnoclostridium sp. Marseille-P6806]|uniref:hypothetical protein n=1 Tax=Lachnoclostridium sp. Marseille-P6806 TaxID=2364793 RepID=UPI0010317875|nr:hypothetical protein [Lachnoclostridium sp. Marseille-P6806]
MDLPNIVILDDERSYALHLLEYLKRKQLPYEICAFFSPERMLLKMNRDNTAVLVVAESEYGGKVVEADFRELLILGETEQYLGPGLRVVSKYQSMEVIFAAILELCMKESRENGGAALPALRHSTQLKIIGIYSPNTRCLQTTVSLTLGQLLAQKYRTLYMNFENYSGFTQLLGRQFRGSVCDLVYYNDVARAKVAAQIGLMAEEIGGLFMIPPVHSFLELQSIQRDQWIDLFRTIEEVTEYEYLLLDLSESTNGLLDVLRECALVITLIRPGCRISEARMQQYREILRQRGYEDVYAKTRRWQLPLFRELPANLCELTHGELAACVRKLMEDVGELRCGAAANPSERGGLE